LRTIALQLGEYTPEQSINLLVDREALDSHLGHNVVLLLDELNNLGVPLDNDASELLREMFLDRAGRFLVFSSHFPVSMDMVPNSPSMRGVFYVTMSRSSTLAELRNMSVECEALTEERAAWLGYIPSLIYSSIKYGCGLTPSSRFQQMYIAIKSDEKLDILQRFVRELISGQREPLVAQYFGSFASVGANFQVSYPLCYVKEIFKKLCIIPAVSVLVNILDKLEDKLNSKHSGLAWECIVEVAIILRMLETHWYGWKGPFMMVPEGTKPDLAFRTLPDECDTLENAKVRIDNMIAEYKSPTLFFVVSANARFPGVEGFIIYTSGCLDSESTSLGFQTKTSDVKPRKDMNTSLINGGAVLIRGNAPAKSPKAPKFGWSYMTSSEVREFLGTSLLLALPREWLQDPLILNDIKEL
jgi:hypothetical protein